MLHFFQKHNTKYLSFIRNSAAHDKMDKSAICSVTSGDEIEDLAENINSLYRNLLRAIHNLELEKSMCRKARN